MGYSALRRQISSHRIYIHIYVRGKNRTKCDHNTFHECNLVHTAESFFIQTDMHKSKNDDEFTTLHSTPNNQNISEAFLIEEKSPRNIPISIRNEHRSSIAAVIVVIIIVASSLFKI